MTPDSAGPQPGFASKGDFISDGYIGLRMDQPFAQQRFQFDLLGSTTHYNTFSYLDFNALNYRGTWLWALTPHLTGRLGADRSQTQIPFSQTGGSLRNVRTTDSQDFSVDGWVSGAWHLLAGAGHTVSETQQTVLSNPSYRNHRLEAGLRYVATSGNSITYMQRWIPAELVDQALDPVYLIDTNYRDTESELRTNWTLSENSSVDGGVNFKRRTNDHFSRRDFSGIAGDFHYHWTPTGKLQFDLVASRNLLSYAAFGNTIENSTYKVDQTYSLGAIWQVDAKVVARMNLARTHSDYRGPVFASAPGAVRVDNVTMMQIGVEWAAMRSLIVNARLERNTRSSNVSAFQFSENMATIGAALTF
jgi:exopolysaccharide biosynthesis operon protein EpsL